MVFITELQIAESASYDRWINCMEEAFEAVADGSVIIPKRSHIDFDSNSLLLMPCIGTKYFTTKLVSFFPGNRKTGKPSIYGTVLLNDSKTGELLAVIDGTKLTAMRTAAVGSVGVRHLSPVNTASLGIIGLGVQGYHQALFACSQRPINKIYVYDIQKENIIKFCNDLSKVFPRIKILPSGDGSEVCRNSEIIITTTNSGNPVLPEDISLLEGKTFIAIGSYKPDMRELPDALFKLVDYVFIDTEHGMAESGDLTAPLEQGLLRENRFINANDLLLGKTVPKNPTRLFKLVGMAAFDLYAAILVYESQNQDIKY